MKHKQGFTGGLDRDSSKSKYRPDKYYYASNFRILTNEGLSSGSIESEKGHVLSFKIPDLPETTYLNGDVIPAQIDLKIIGVGNINDTIVVFTTNETSATPDSYGQIWKFTYDENSNEIENISGSDELDPNFHLVYNNKLNFSSHYRIGKVIGSYETSAIQRVYWTDNYNPVRVINIVNPDSLEIDPDNLDLRPDIDFAQPVIQKVGTGSIPVGSMVQYAYRLIDTGGAVSLFSPTSTLYPLTADSPYTTNSFDFNGDDPQTSNSRSVTYTINGIDTDYQYIEHVAIFYETIKDAPRIYKFAEQQVPASGIVEVTHVGDEDTVEISLVEFNQLSSGFDKCKDIEVKKNRLIAANTSTAKFDIDFESRVYRFNLAKQAKLLDSSLGTFTLLGPAPLYNTVPEEHDAINPYNNENDVNWASLNQYKYQADGATLGGSGLNISYKFINRELYGDTAPTTSVANHVQVGRFSAGTSKENTLGIINPDGTPLTVERSNQIFNNIGPYNHSFFRGYARGEVYRYGIVFYNKKGQNSFVKWIGDIRMPEPSEGFIIGSTNGGIATIYNLGIQFTVDVSSIQDQISGYSFVRVERKAEDKTRLGTGTIMLFDRQNSGDETSVIERYQLGNALPATDFTNNTKVNGSVNGSIYHLNDKPGFTGSTSKEGFGFISPISNIDSIVSKTGDFIKTYGYYESQAYFYAIDTADDRYGVHYKMRSWVPSDHGNEYLEIEDGRRVNHGEYIPANSDILDAIGDVNGFINASYSKDSGTDANIPLGIGDRKFIGILSGAPTVSNAVPYTSMDWYGSGDYSTLGFVGPASNTVYFKEVAYARYLVNQYGGSTFENRAVNQYISTGHYQAINDITGTSFIQTVWGGDVFTNYYDHEYYKFYATESETFADPYEAPGDSKLSIAIVCPCETYMNADLRNGVKWCAVRNGGDFTTFDSVLSVNINGVYSQESNVIEKYFSKDFISNFVEEQPTRLWASEAKINGELIDNWRIFKDTNSIEVVGTYGPINRISNFKDNLYFHQDSAFGAASIGDRSVVTDENGIQLELGSGGILDHYQYVSVITGSVHQFGVITTDNAMYWYDARLKKLQRYSGQGIQPLSDIKGMSSWFDKQVNGDIVNTDKTLSEILVNPIGVHAIPDYRHNRVLFTFLGNKIVKTPSNPDKRSKFFNVGELIYSEVTGLYYEVITQFSIPQGTSVNVNGNENLVVQSEDFQNAFTISYNEVTEAFVSFYGYKPGLYYNYGRRLLSVDPFNKDRMYVHNIGDYCSYYGKAPEPSEITLQLSPNADITKIWNNIEYNSEVTLLNSDIFNESLTSYRVYNEYQDTGTITFSVDNNLKRRMRTWRFDIDRDNTDGISRIRNPYIFLHLKYNNNSNKRFILHDIIVSFTPSPH